MKIIDISWPITSDMTGYKNRKEVMFSLVKSYEKDMVRESRIMLGSHTGTHVDAPAHMIASGVTIDQVPLQNLIGQAAVIDLTSIDDCIEREHLEQFEIPKGVILLLLTKNSFIAENAQFNGNFIYLTADAAAYCVEIGIRALGIDYLGIERNQPDHETHKILLKNKISIIEGLRLAHVEPNFYFFVCLPISVIGLEAAPARAILIADI
jgi:arylformamidase